MQLHIQAATSHLSRKSPVTIKGGTEGEGILKEVAMQEGLSLKYLR